MSVIFYVIELRNLHFDSFFGIAIFQTIMESDYYGNFTSILHTIYQFQTQYFWLYTTNLLSRSCFLLKTSMTAVIQNGLNPDSLFTIVIRNVDSHHTSTDYFSIKLGINWCSCHIIFSGCIPWWSLGGC